MLRHLAPFVLLLLAAALPGCGRADGHGPGKGMPALTLPGTTGRAGPVYVQWLTKQSLLQQAREASATTEGTLHLWENGAQGRPASLVLDAAPTWLAVTPGDGSRRTPWIASLSSLESLQKLVSAQGLYVSNIGEDDDIWAPDSLKKRAPLPGPVSLSPAHAVGSEKELRACLRSCEQKAVQTGADICPAATGLGPDFMLQARNAAMHRGLYLLFPLDDRAAQSFAGLLPPAQSEWDCQALSPEAVRALTAGGALPPEFFRDTQSFLPQTGWAITGPVTGTDGTLHRYLYRYEGSPRHPVLCWQDPSGSARALLTGSVILSTGLRGMTLAGIQLSGLAGLEPRGNTPQQGESSWKTLAPYPEALSSVSSQIHRCGGWSILRDVLPPSLLPQALARADFGATPVLSLSLTAMETGDAAPLADWLRRMLRQESSPASDKMESIQTHLANGLLPVPEQAALPQKLSAIAGRCPATEQAAAFHALLALPAGLPGLCFLPLEILQGQLSSDTSSLLWENAGREGTPAALLAGALQVRSSLHAASGHVSSVETPAPGVIALTTVLPNADLLLTLVNFSAGKQAPTIVIPFQNRVLSPRLLTQAPSGTLRVSGQNLVFSLNPRQAVHVLVPVSR